MFKIILLSSIILFHLVASTCPNGATPIPSGLGSNWSCILPINNLVPFLDAEINCQVHNGHLLSISNGFLNAFVTNLINPVYGDRHFWIGITQLVGGIWKNVDDGKNTTYFNWAIGQPWNDPDHKCVSIGSQGYWYSSYVCDKYFPYICEVTEIAETESTLSLTEQN